MISVGSKVLVTGCGGMLGEAVRQVFSRDARVFATDLLLTEPWLALADVRDLSCMLATAREIRPDLILHLAALTDLEDCERRAEEAWRTNALGTENLVLVARDLDVPLVYIGTAGIFDGALDSYHDFDLPNPLGVYAKSKLHGETVVQRMVPRHFVFRAGWMMGGGVRKDKKFIAKLFRQIASGARVLQVVDDKLGTPTYTVDFAETMLRTLRSGYHGLYNMACGGGGSRLDVAREFVRLLGLEDEIVVERVDSSHFESEYFAPRPRSEQLVNLKLESRGLNTMRPWRECLAEYAECFRGELAEIRSRGRVERTAR